MIVQKHREYEKDIENGCFSVGKNEEELFADLKTCCKNNKDKSIYYYIHPIRPNKENLRPEYMMEIAIIDQTSSLLMSFWRKAQ